MGESGACLKSQNQYALAEKLSAPGWGAFFIWAGIAFLTGIGWGAGLLGGGNHRNRRRSGAEIPRHVRQLVLDDDGNPVHCRWSLRIAYHPTRQRAPADPQHCFRCRDPGLCLAPSAPFVILRSANHSSLSTNHYSLTTDPLSPRLVIICRPTGRAVAPGLSPAYSKQRPAGR